MRFEDELGFDWVLDLHYISTHAMETGEKNFFTDTVSQYDPFSGEHLDVVFMQRMRREHPWPEQPKYKRCPWLIAHSIPPAWALAEELDR